MPERLINPKQANIAAKAIKKQGTKFTAPGGHYGAQTVPAKHLRATTYVYPPGPRRTGKPSSYKA